MFARPSDKKNIFLSGIFVTFLLGLTMFFLFIIGEQSSLFQEHLVLHARVDNARNLKVGAAVQLKGIKIGTVQSIEFEEINSLIINFKITRKYEEWVRKDSYVAFKTQGVLGDKFIEILGGSDDVAAVKNNDFLQLKMGPEMDQFITKGEDVLVLGSKILARLENLLGAIESDHVKNIFTNLDNSTKQTTDFFKLLDGKKLATTIDHLEKTSKSLADISKQIKDGPGTVHSLIYDPTVHDDLQVLLGGAKRNKILQYFIRESINKKQ